MPPITNPAQLDHPALRELAGRAAWVAQLEEAVEALEDLVVPLADDPGDELEGADEDAGADEKDPLAVALSVVQSAYEEADRELEDAVVAWLAEDPEHWPIFRLLLLDPWQEEPGRWKEDVPRWVRTLETNTVLAHFQHDPYGRRRTLDL